MRSLTVFDQCGNCYPFPSCRDHSDHVHTVHTESIQYQYRKTTQNSFEQKLETLAGMTLSKVSVPLDV